MPYPLDYGDERESKVESTRWDKGIPPEAKEEIGDAVRTQMTHLPEHLQVEWQEPKLLEKRWFQEASEFINIPYPEYWAE